MFFEVEKVPNLDPFSLGFFVSVILVSDDNLCVFFGENSPIMMYNILYFLFLLFGFRENC